MARWEDQNFAVYFLGAGFSVNAGLPVANALWSEVYRRATGQPDDLRASKFDRDVEAYIRYQRESFGRKLTPATINFEEFLGYLDIEFHLGLLGSDTWSDDGNETQVIVKTLIGQIITELTPPASKIPDVYRRFARKLKPHDVVLTFNYDILLERALEEVGTKFRLFPTRYKRVFPDGGGESDNDRDEVTIIKLHGSVDWFNRKKHDEHVEYRKVNFPDLNPPEHPIFNSGRGHMTVPLVDGPREKNDPLAQIHRIRDVERYYRSPALFQATPVLILPSTNKVFSAQQFRDFWWGMSSVGSRNFRMAVIGYSLPQHDAYAHQVLYDAIQNYQRVEWSSVFSGKKKAKLRLIDFRLSKKAVADYKKRFAFVNWDRATVHLDGFGAKALRLL